MTIYKTFLSRGFFPKELPPAFFTDQFAVYATSKAGRTVLSGYKPRNNFTEPVRYRLALPGAEYRQLHLPHPASFSELASICATSFRRLLQKAGVSRFSKSRPVYASGRYRAVNPLFKPSNLARERANSRAGASFLLKADVSQFYPSLYTHAVGWAVDPKLRDKKNWNNTKLLGKKLDQALMNLQGKVSQGITIGNDLSFLLAEVVLAQVDRAIGLPPERCYRWFDDYEIACDGRAAAEHALSRLSKELDRFRLRLNPKKTRLAPLPQPTQEEWQAVILGRSRSPLTTSREMVQYFDEAFRLRERFPETPVLMYALGTLFRLQSPTPEAARVAQSGISQTILCEPGSAQKAFALLTFWRLNGLPLDGDLWAHTISQMVVRHAAGGVSSDVAWGLAFCLEQKIALDAAAAKILSAVDDDCIALQALHMHVSGLFPRGFTTKRLSRLLKTADLDGEHWLIAYESLRQGFLTDTKRAVQNNVLFADLLAKRITFYRTHLPPYASVVHPGGGPDWAVHAWIRELRITREKREEVPSPLPILELMRKDLSRLSPTPKSDEEIIAELLDILSAREQTAMEPYV